MNNRETNENMHSNSTRANFVNRIPCLWENIQGKRQKAKHISVKKKKKKKKHSSEIRSYVDGLETKRFIH